MARTRYIYRPDESGRYKPVQISGGLIKRDEVNAPFEEQMIRAYHTMECNLGSHFRPDYGHHTAAQIKGAWSRKD